MTLYETLHLQKKHFKVGSQHFFSHWTFALKHKCMKMRLKQVTKFYSVFYYLTLVQTSIDRVCE